MPADPLRLPRPDQELIAQIRAGSRAPRPAWVEIDTAQLDRNFALIRAEMPPNLQLLVVVKDQAYGHGAIAVARAALAAGATWLGVNTLGEGLELRHAGIDAPILLLGERHPDELPFCLQQGLAVSVGDFELARLLDRLAQQAGRCLPVHLKVDTGMSRFGVRWDAAAPAAAHLARLPGLILAGVMSHFSMSDESDKSFALDQIDRFQQFLRALEALRIRPGLRHHCNSGGYLDLPQAHFDLVRLGILPLGVYPSAVCRRIPGLQPVLSVKARLVVVRTLQPGDVYGYGLKYRAPSVRRIGVLPLGYGDGYPRLRNAGHVLVNGQRAPIVGGVAMDAIGVDLTGIPQAALWDEAVILGRQGSEEISAHDLAVWKGSVSYDILTGWRSRLPRVELP